MRRATGLLMMIGLILAAAPALAKGSMSATISGPGIDEPIELFDPREPEQVMHEHIVDLIEQTGLWYATPTLERIDQPGGLGEPLVLTWGEGSHTIRQDIYLHAEGGPVIHTLESPPWRHGPGREITGWFRAPTGLVDTLRAFGVPTSAGRAAVTTSPALVLGGLVFLILIAARLVNSRLRPVVSSQ